LASRLEGQSQAHRILISQLTHDRLAGRYALEPRGAVDIKGYGAVQAWFLTARLGEGVAEPSVGVSQSAPLAGR
jgi:class 3 adenylate cyclase